MWVSVCVCVDTGLFVQYKSYKYFKIMHWKKICTTYLNHMRYLNVKCSDGSSGKYHIQDI